MPSVRSDPLEELVIPDGSHVEEHDLVVDGDVIVGGQSTVEFGVRGRNVIAGERVQFDGHIEAEGDCRLDMWCTVGDNVLVGEDAYLGERVEIDGELKVAGDLDIGDDVDIEEGFEANGWIVIRNPMPTIVFLFVYLSQLLRIGEEEAAEQMLAAVIEEGDREDEPVIVPRGSRVGDDAWRVSTPARVGDDCRLHGNVRAASLTVGHDNEIFGGLRARGDITVGSGTEITGNVTTREGDVRIGPGVEIRGDVAGEHVAVHSGATVEGEIRASDSTTMLDEAVLEDAVVGSGGSAAADSASPEPEQAEAESPDPENADAENDDSAEDAADNDDSEDTDADASDEPDPSRASPEEPTAGDDSTPEEITQVITPVGDEPGEDEPRTNGHDEPEVAEPSD